MDKDEKLLDKLLSQFAFASAQISWAGGVGDYREQREYELYWKAQKSQAKRLIKRFFQRKSNNGKS